MNSNVLLGIVIIVLTVLFGWLGGAVCILAGLVLGIVLIAIGIVNPKKEDESQIKKSEPDRRCPKCGRNIPIDADFCPYCTYRFIKDDTKEKDNITSLEILKRRYAKGEITEDEYEKMKKKLEG